MFFKVKSSEEVFEILKGFPPVNDETVFAGEAYNRILSRTVTSEEDMPDFSRSSVDGYAVIARDTFGASDTLPAFLELAGEVLMGKASKDAVTPGKAIRISTGGMIPEGADAVVMIEYCHSVDEKTIEISRSVAPLENIISRGDDYRKGSGLLEKGAVLRPQDIGLLAGQGIQNVHVYKRPKVGIISTGDEIIPIDQHPKPGQIRDINSYTLSAFCSQEGAIPLNMGLCKDSFDELRNGVVRALDQCESVWISGGSSVGLRDMTLKVLESFQDAEILVHGIAIRPGKPTIIARIGSKSLFGLPGHVASAMVVAEIFLTPFLAWLSGEGRELKDNHFYLSAELERNIESAGGRDDYIRVKLTTRAGKLYAEPIYGKSGLISTMVEARGLVKIDRNTEGLYKGQTVRVMLFKPYKGDA